MILLCLVQGSFPTLFAHHGKTDSRVAHKFSPFIVDIDSIIEVYVQYVGSSVIHNVESKCARHDLFHLFNTLRVIHHFTLSIWSEDDHRAVAAALMHRQNCTFCVRDAAHVEVTVTLPVLDRLSLEKARQLERNTLNQFSKSFPQPCRMITSLSQLLDTSHRTLLAHVAKRMQKLLLLIREKSSLFCLFMRDYNVAASTNSAGD